MKKILTPLLLVITLSFSAKAQVKFQAHAGLGYTEHFSIGAGCTFSKKHSISLLYGSNFFVRQKEFSSFLLQYNFILHKLKFAGITPTVGIKGGHIIYTDDYYTWNLAVFIPFIALQYPINRKIDLLVKAGSAVSFEQSAKRISYGEIGHYKEILPEVRAGIAYNFVRAPR